MNDLSQIEIIFWGSTIIGGTLFLLRTILMFIGGDMGDHDVGADFDGEMDFDADHSGTGVDTDFNFRLLSMQGLTAFFMMFGLVGLALLRANVLVGLTIAGGVLAGLVTVLIISLVLAQVTRFRSSGNVDLENAVGQRGTVYLSIPAGGTGQVQVPVQGSLKIVDAASKGGEAILTGENVRVTGLLDNNTLFVEKTNPHE